MMFPSNDPLVEMNDVFSVEELAADDAADAADPVESDLGEVTLDAAIDKLIDELFDSLIGKLSIPPTN